MDHNVQFGMSPASIDAVGTPCGAEMTPSFKMPGSVLPSSHRSASISGGPSNTAPLFPPMTPLVAPQSVHGPSSMLNYAPATPATVGDANIPVPQLQNIVSTVNLGAKSF